MQPYNLIVFIKESEPVLFSRVLCGKLLQCKLELTYILDS